MCDVLQVRSLSTRIADVADPKKSYTVEHEPDHEHGYLWRMRATLAATRKAAVGNR